MNCWKKFRTVTKAGKCGRYLESFSRSTNVNFPSRYSLWAFPLRTIMSCSLSKGSDRKVTLLPGDGIGPEICDSVIGVFQAANIPIRWERYDSVSFHDSFEEDPHLFQELIASIARNRICLKGPFYTPIRPPGFQSKNLKLRKQLDLFANVVPIRSIPGVPSTHRDFTIDLIIVRENTQGEYSGFEQTVAPGVVQSLKIVTEYASQRIAEYAFQLAVSEKRKKVTCIHKANIQKKTDGLFLQVCRSVAQKNPSIQFNEMIVDNACMQLVMNPTQFDILLCPNLYGHIITNVATGLIGGPGLIGGANVGEGIALFEPGSRHVGLDIAGKNTANPIAMLHSGTMLLRHLELDEPANRIDAAIRSVITGTKIFTKDLGGNASTKDITHAIIDRLASVS